MSLLIRHLKNGLYLFSDENLTQKAYLNALASGLEYVARLLVGFLITPFMVVGLGNYFFGTWQMLNRMVGYMSPASGKPTQALKWTIASQQSSPDYEQKRQFVGSAMVVWLIFFPFMVILGSVIAWFVPIWIDSPENFYGVVRITTALLVINLALTSLVSIPRSVLQGENLGYKRLGMSVLLVFLGGGLTWLALYLDSGLVGVALAALVTTFVTGIFYYYVVRIYAAWFGVIKPTFKAALDFLGLSGWFLSWNFIWNLLLTSDVLLLGFLNNVESVTSYTLTKYAPEMLLSMVGIMVVGATPGLGGIIGSGERSKASHVRSEIMSLTWLVITAFGTTILLWNRTFIGLWVGANQYAGTISAFLIVLVVAQFAFICNDASIIDLTLKLKHKVFLGAVSLVLSLLTSIVLVAYFKLGIVGLCIGIILGRSILTFGYPILVARLLRYSFYTQLRGVVQPVIIAMIFFSAAAYASKYLPSTGWDGILGWLYFFLLCGLTLGVASVLAFYSGLSPHQQKNIISRIKIILNRPQV